MDEVDFTAFSDDQLDQFVTGLEARMGALRVLQMRGLREVDRRQTPLADGCRSLVEWATGRLDVTPDNAKTLVATARRLEELPVIEETSAAGELSFDRTAAVARLAQPGDDEQHVLAEAAGLDVAAIHRQVVHRRRLSRKQEQRAFRERYVATQPNLDHTALDFHGRLSGVAGRVFEEALHSVGDQLPDAPGVTSRATRNADALWKMSQDALNSGSDTATASASLVTVFVDANRAAATGGEAGMVVRSGPRVGPNLLEALACNSKVEVTGVTHDGTPLNLGRRSRTIAPQLRRSVLHRDGGVCTADGCTSRYRLEAHHIVPWSQGGRTDADNLTTLCWYHHHVTIHGEGHTIDPNSPTCRRRFKPPRDHDPP